VKSQHIGGAEVVGASDVLCLANFSLYSRQGRVVAIDRKHCISTRLLPLLFNRRAASPTFILAIIQHGSSQGFLTEPISSLQGPHSIAHRTRSHPISQASVFPALVHIFCIIFARGGTNLRDWISGFLDSDTWRVNREPPCSINRHLSGSQASCEI
jgi:hypothetical protein